MASWMIHLRIADAMLTRLRPLSETEFIVGNIAPDSGVPNDDLSQFTPSKKLSHFLVPDTNGHSKISADSFADRYFTKALQAGYTLKQYSFYLGYLVHLMTDVLWISEMLPKLVMKNKAEYDRNPDGFVWKWKKDCYDLDALFIKENPSFRAFDIFSKAEGFKNEYLDFFPPDAFDLRRRYITDFYLAPKNDLDREYIYITEKDISYFINSASEAIINQLSVYIYSQS